MVTIKKKKVLVKLLLCSVNVNQAVAYQSEKAAVFVTVVAQIDNSIDTVTSAYLLGAFFAEKDSKPEIKILSFFFIFQSHLKDIQSAFVSILSDSDGKYYHNSFIL